MAVRLHHPNFFSCTFVVELPTVMPKPVDCPSCGKTHENKSIHLRLDAQGDVEVSDEIYEKLLVVGLAGMQAANEAKNPREQRVGAIAIPNTKVIEHTLNDSEKQEFWRPGRTKYESEELVQRPLRPLLDAWGEVLDSAEIAAKKTKRIILDLGRRR